MEIAKLLSEGRTGREIAARLGISTSTVSYHKSRLHLRMNPKCARRHDWGAIQHYYDEGHSVRACTEAFDFSSKSWDDAVKRGAVTPRPQALPLDELLAKNRKRGRRNLNMRLLAAGVKQN